MRQTVSGKDRLRFWQTGTALFLPLEREMPGSWRAVPESPADRITNRFSSEMRSRAFDGGSAEIGPPGCRSRGFQLQRDIVRRVVQPAGYAAATESWPPGDYGASSRS